MTMTRQEVQAIVDQVDCPPYRFRLIVKETDEPVMHLQAQLFRVCTETGKEGWGSGGKYYLSPHMTIGEIVKKCFVAARDYAEHEVREAFRWKGRQILGPHLDVQALWEVAEVKESRS